MESTRHVGCFAINRWVITDNVVKLYFQLCRCPDCQMQPGWWQLSRNRTETME